MVKELLKNGAVFYDKRNPKLKYVWSDDRHSFYVYFMEQGKEDALLRLAPYTMYVEQYLLTDAPAPPVSEKISSLPPTTEPLKTDKVIISAPPVSAAKVIRAAAANKKKIAKAKGKKKVTKAKKKKVK